MGDSPSHCVPPCHAALTELRLYQAFIFSTPILFSLVILLLFYMLYLRRGRTAFAASQIRAQFLARGLIASQYSECGLDKSFRDMLPIIVFNESVAAKIHDTQCSVCLGEYQVNEKLQHLPFCGHAFHLECIDKWLSNNTTCPLCRTSLLQAMKIIPLNLGAQTVNTEQAFESTGVIPQASLPQQDHPMEGLHTEEDLDLRVYSGGT